MIDFYYLLYPMQLYMLKSKTPIKGGPYVPLIGVLLLLGKFLPNKKVETLTSGNTGHTIKYTSCIS